MVQKGTVQVKIGGSSYPCRLTMGAMVRFKRLTGKEVNEVSGIDDTAALLYSCIASACAADKVPFALSFEEFCDGVSMEDMAAMSATLEDSGEADEEEKKSPLPSEN